MNSFSERILFLEETDSTNAYLRSLAENGAPDGQTVVAKRQTAGRGRMGRSFDSREGGLYLSYLVRVGAEDPFELTGRAAVAVRRAIECTYGISVDIKWLNDLVLNKRKICGMLAQGLFSKEGGIIILGVGVNVNQASFPQELETTASSLLMETGKEYDIFLLAENIVSQLDSIRKGSAQSVLEEYRASCLTIGRSITVVSAKERRTAFALSVNDDFSLSVRYENGEEKKVSSGEVSVRGLYDYT